MVHGNALKSIVERDARIAAHLLLGNRSIQADKTSAHRRYRRHVARQLYHIAQGRRDCEAWDVHPGGRRLTGWDVA